MDTILGIISIVVVVGCVGYLIYAWRKGKKK